MYCRQQCSSATAVARLHGTLRCRAVRVQCGLRMAGKGRAAARTAHLPRLAATSFSNIHPQVVYPALDSKVKNVTLAYSVEHEDEVSGQERAV